MTQHPIAYLDVDSHFCPDCATAHDEQDPGTLAGLLPVTDAATLPEGAACYTCSRPLRVIPPEQQIENVRKVLADVRAVAAAVVDAEYLATVERHLAELEARHERGELAPLPDDGLPF